MPKIKCDIIAIVHRLWIDGRRKTGGLDMVLDYWLDQGKRICLVEHPLEETRESYVTIREKNRDEVVFYKGGVTPFRGVLQWLGEVIFNIFFILGRVKGCPLLATSDLLNNAVGILLPFKFRKFYFHCVDYSARRFVHPVLNSVYKLLLKLSFRQADLISVVSSRARKAMANQGGDLDKIFQLPNSPYYRDFNYQHPNTDQKEPFSIIYTSTKVISRYCYYELLTALKVVKRSVPGVALYITGKKDSEPDYFNRLLSVINQCKLADSVKFTGLVDKQRLNELLVKVSIGVALHAPELDYYYHFADPLKVREYAAYGLPTVTDRNSSIADDLEQEQAGLVIDNLSQLPQVIIDLFNNPNLYQRISNNARQWAQANDKQRLLVQLSSRLQLICD